MPKTCSETPENTRSGTTLRPPSEPVCTPRPCPKPVPKHQKTREAAPLPDLVLSDSLYSFGAKHVSEIMKMNDFRTRFWAIHYVALVRNRCRKWRKWTISSDSLYSFGAKEVSEMMTMNDFRTQFSTIPYIALVRNMCRKWWKWTTSEPGFERFVI